MRSFLGAFQNLKIFIVDFSHIASPLHDVTDKRQVFQWGKQQQTYFDTLKQKLIIAPMLALPNL